MQLIFDANKSNFSDFSEKDRSVKEKVVLIIPTYNEAAVIKTTIEQVFASVDSDHYDFHVLIFDSASEDTTQQIVSTLQASYPKLHLNTEPKKSGLGSAYLQAMHYALNTLNADIVFEFDADLSHQPKYIQPMLDGLKNCDCILGSRYVVGGSIPNNWGLHRKLFSILGNYVARAILTPKYKDFTTGFRATRRQQLIKILPKKFLSSNYAYKLQLLWLLHQNKARIHEYPIDFIDRDKGYSKLPKNSIIDSLHVVITLRYYEMKRYLKMCLVGSLGIVVQFSSYNLLRDCMHSPPFQASQIAVFFAILSNYILNSKLTFKVSKKISRALKAKRLLIFILYSIGIIYLQSYWLDLGIIFFGSGPLCENLIIGSGLGLISFLNYFIYSRHIWAPPNET